MQKADESSDDLMMLAAVFMDWFPEDEMHHTGLFIVINCYTGREYPKD